MPVPSDFDMRRPSGARTIECTLTSSNGSVADELEAHHHHPRHPEVDDVAGRRQDLRGEVGAQLLGVLGPAQDGERPQRRREPGVEDVRVARPARSSRTRAVPARSPGRWSRRAAVPHGQLVAPPELARDAPGADVVHPVEVDALAALGVEAHAAFADGRVGRASQLGHLAEPLQGDERLDAVAGALRSGRRSGSTAAGS